MIQVVALLHLHVDKMKEIVILTMIAKLVLSVDQIIAHLASTSLLMLTVVYQVIVALLHLHVEKMKEIVILTVIA